MANEDLKERRLRIRRRQIINDGPLSWPDDQVETGVLADPLMVLNAMIVVQFWKTQRQLRIDKHAERAWIQCDVFAGGYTGDMLSDGYEIPVDFKVAQELISERLVAGQPYMGYTSDTEFNLSQIGTDRVVRESEELRRGRENEQVGTTSCQAPP